MATFRSAVGTDTSLNAASLFSRRRISEQMGTGPAIHMEQVSYTYAAFARLRPAHVWTLSGLTHTFRAGVVTGLLGRNGSGKSTLLSLAAGLRRPYDGTVELRDRHEHQQVWDQPLPRAAIMFAGSGRFLNSLSNLDDLVSLACLTMPLMSRADATRYLRMFDLPDDIKPSRASLGQRAAIEAAIVLASHAPVLLLDEIHHGMDAVVRRRFWDALLELYAWERPTIIIASHDLDQIEHLLEDAAILAGGKIAASGTVDDLRTRYAQPGEVMADLTDVVERVTQENKR